MMRKNPWIAAVLLVASLSLSACAPLIFGGGAAVVADQVAEDQNGGDGLF
jgi:hypothetical protein